MLVPQISICFSCPVSCGCIIHCPPPVGLSVSRA